MASNLFDRIARDSTTQPLTSVVPGESAAEFRQQIGSAKLLMRSLQRRTVFRCMSQHRRKLDRLPADARSVLWLYEGEQQLGDALMDLAPRSLLQQHGIAVDLVAHPAVVPMFERDPWLRDVTADPLALAGRTWDACIALSNKSRSLHMKKRFFPDLPWVSLHEYFTGPNFHRGLFTAQRLADLLATPLSPEARELHGRQKLRPAGPLPPGLDPQFAREAIAIAVGGVRADRIYAHWSQMALQLSAQGLNKFRLVGSANGREQADRTAGELAGHAELVDCAGRLDLDGTRAVLATCRLVVCVDGGLMHLAATTPAPILILFNAQIQPAWRLPGDLLTHALRAPGNDVSGLPPRQVALAVLQALARRPTAGAPEAAAAGMDESRLQWR